MTQQNWVLRVIAGTDINKDEEKHSFYIHSGKHPHLLEKFDSAERALAHAEFLLDENNVIIKIDGAIGCLSIRQVLWFEAVEVAL